MNTYELTKELSEIQDLTQAEMGAKIGKSGAWVSQALTAWKKSTEKLKLIWAEGTLPFKVIKDLASLPEDEQDRAVDEQIKLRREEGAHAASRARKTLLGERVTVKRSSRPGVKELTDLLISTDDMNLDGYAKGVRDCLRYVLGGIGIGELDEEWSEVMRSVAEKTNAKFFDAEE